MLVSFFISGLFLQSSGMFDDDMNFNEEKYREIASELDKIPFIHIDLQGEDYQGNAGATCVQDVDCNTPVDYLIQSNCAFGSACIDNTCRVVCPIPYPDAVEESCEDDEECDCEERGIKTSECVCSSGKCLSVEA